MIKWNLTTEKTPSVKASRPLEYEVIGYKKEWECPDFNPNGTRVCVFSDYGWSCARWNNSKDSWITDSEGMGDEDCVPTHWIEMINKPDSHEQVEKCDSARINESIKYLTEVVAANNTVFGCEKTLSAANKKIRELISKL